MRFFVLSWLFVAVLIGYSGLLRNTRLPMPALGVAITLALIAAIAVRRDYRERALRAGVRPLVAVHLVRFAGIYVLWLSSRGLLPRDFAMSAGWGHIVVAALAAIVLLAVRPETKTGRTAILVWNVIGVVGVLFVFATRGADGEHRPVGAGGIHVAPAQPASHLPRAADHRHAHAHLRLVGPANLKLPNSKLQKVLTWSDGFPVHERGDDLS